MIIELILRWFNSFFDYKIGAYYNYDYNQFNELVNYHILKIIFLFVLTAMVLMLIIIEIRSIKEGNIPPWYPSKRKKRL